MIKRVKAIGKSRIANKNPKNQNDSKISITSSTNFMRKELETNRY
jgi:hypothetical protein